MEQHDIVMDAVVTDSKKSLQDWTADYPPRRV